MNERYPDKFMPRLRKAFLDYGYGRVSMIALAEACDVTRRALYNHFSNKQEAFRAVLQWRHALEIDAGMTAGERCIADGGSTLDAIVVILDTRYGEARRDLEHSPHAAEINREAFHRCHDIMSASAETFQQRLSVFLEGQTDKRLLELKPDMSPADVAQCLADGARGVNQTLPLRPVGTLAQRYRRMCAAVLYGCAAPPPA